MWAAVVIAVLVASVVAAGLGALALRLTRRAATATSEQTA